MNKIIRISAAALLLVAACQKTELPENNTTQENPAPEAVLSEEQALIKSMLAKRDTRWTVDELDIPEVSGEWNLIANEKELAFLLEFGCAEGGKYRLENDLNLASSEIAEKFTSEIGIEKFVNFEFDGNDKTISGLKLPIAAGLSVRFPALQKYMISLWIHSLSVLLRMSQIFWEQDFCAVQLRERLRFRM